MSKLLGLDWGSKRLGVAVGDSQHGLAYPRSSLENDEQLVDRLQQLIRDEAITTIIMGLPRNQHGAETAQSRVVRQFGARLQLQLGVPVHFQDESLTTHQATKQPNGRFDDHSLAAAIILQDYLDAWRR